MTNIIKELLKRPIAYQPVIAKAFGSVNLGILWSQLYYWSDKMNDKDGWIFKTSRQLYEETALSRKEQETARKIGLSLGVLEEKLSGNPATLHFRINEDTAFEVINKFLNLIEQKPAKEKQFKTTSSIDYLTNIPQETINEMCAKYQVSEKFIKERADNVINYCKANGRIYKDYNAALINFIKGDLKKYPQERQSQVIEIPKKQQIVNEYNDIKPIQRTPEEEAKLKNKLDNLKNIREELSRKFSI